MYTHMLTFYTYCTVCMCALSYTNTQPHAHIHKSLFGCVFSVSLEVASPLNQS